MALEAIEVPHHVEYLKSLLFMCFCRSESEKDLENGTIPNSATIPILQLHVQVIIKSCCSLKITTTDVDKVSHSFMGKKDFPNS